MLIAPIIFPFAAIYVGDYASSSVLTFIPEMRTNGCQFLEEMPSDYVVVNNKRIQSDNHKVTVTLDFLSDDIVTFNLSRGVSISNSSRTAVPALNQFSLLLVAPTAGSTSNYYFPQINTLCKREIAYTKTAPAGTLITFTDENRDPNTIIYYQDTLTNLISIMGSKSPF